MEYLRGMDKKDVPPDDVLRKPLGDKLVAPEPDDEKKEKRLNCLEQCTDKLESVSRDIIIRYYFGKERIKIENRRTLAESLKITVNALSIRACRIREKLEACVKKCVG